MAEDSPTIRCTACTHSFRIWSILRHPYRLAQSKDPTIVLLISIFLGQFGIDRFFVGDTMMGVLKLITCGGCGIWTIIDWFLIMGVTKDKNYARFNGIF